MTTEQFKAHLVQRLRQSLDDEAAARHILTQTYDALAPWAHEERCRFLQDVVSEADSTAAQSRQPSQRGFPTIGKAYTGATSNHVARTRQSLEQILAEVVADKQSEK